MKTQIALVLAGLMLAACATTEVVEPTVEAEEAVADDATKDAEATLPDCDPADESCDHTGTVFVPPMN